MTFANAGQAVGQGEIMTLAPLDAERTSLVMDIRGLHQISLFMDFVGAGTATGVVVEIDCSVDQLVWCPVQNQEQTPPDKALVTQTWTKSVGVDAKWIFDVAENGRLGAPFMRIRADATGTGTAADTLTINAYGEA